MNTKNSIKEDLIRLGVEQGDTLFLRISYKSIGVIDGGPKTFLDALVDVVGENGTIILTAFPIRYINKLKMFHRKDAVCATERPKSHTGAMSNVAMAYPGAKISKRVDFPFVVIGKHASYLTDNHTYGKNGYWLLEEAITKFNCKCLRIGGLPFIGTTHMSLSHVLQETGQYQMAPVYGLYVKDGSRLTWRENLNVVFCPTAFESYLKEIIEKITIQEGRVGDGYAIITDMNESMRLEEQLFRDNIKDILCDDPNCWICRSSFSFSDSTRIHFLLMQIIKHFKGDIKLSRSKFRSLLELLFLSTKNQ